jgi:DNA-binding response OmpR family regulator
VKGLTWARTTIRLPFDLTGLARVRALIRRTAGTATDTLRVGEVAIDVRSPQVMGGRHHPAHADTASWNIWHTAAVVSRTEHRTPAR